MTKRFCRRPWGFWIVLLDRKHFKVKLLRFKKNGALSFQYHNHRGELWLFLKGEGGWSTGYNHRNEKLPASTCKAEANEFRFAAQNLPHTFRAWKPTWVLEVQYGEVCEEEDIVRI